MATLRIKRKNVGSITYEVEYCGNYYTAVVVVDARGKGGSLHSLKRNNGKRETSGTTRARIREIVLNNECDLCDRPHGEGKGQCPNEGSRGCKIIQGRNQMAAIRRFQKRS